MRNDDVRAQLSIERSPEQARSFFEIEAGREAASVSQLERQISARAFQRLAAKGNAATLATEGQYVSKPEHVLKDPLFVEFLGLSENPADHERGVERLEAFMLELGKASFFGRQRRISLEGDHFYVDLVFYNRLLRCFVLVDLKLGKLTHQDLGQMQMYVNWFDRFQRASPLPDESSVLAARFDPPT